MAPRELLVVFASQGVLCPLELIDAEAAKHPRKAVNAIALRFVHLECSSRVYQFAAAAILHILLSVAPCTPPAASSLGHHSRPHHGSGG